MEKKYIFEEKPSSFKEEDIKDWDSLARWIIAFHRYSYDFYYEGEVFEGFEILNDFFNFSRNGNGKEKCEKIIFEIPEEELEDKFLPFFLGLMNESEASYVYEKLTDDLIEIDGIIDTKPLKNSVLVFCMDKFLERGMRFPVEYFDPLSEEFLRQSDTYRSNPHYTSKEIIENATTDSFVTKAYCTNITFYTLIDYYSKYLQDVFVKYDWSSVSGGLYFREKSENESDYDYNVEDILSAYKYGCVYLRKKYPHKYDQKRYVIPRDHR